jgi:hypothetical protein
MSGQRGCFAEDNGTDTANIRINEAPDGANAHKHALTSFLYGACWGFLISSSPSEKSEPWPEAGEARAEGSLMCLSFFLGQSIAHEAPQATALNWQNSQVSLRKYGKFGVGRQG